MKLIDILNEIIEEKKADRCLRIARRKYDKPSAYRSGAIVRCRQGKIWKGLNEEKELNIQDLAYEKIPGLLQKGIDAGLEFLTFVLDDTLEGVKAATNPQIKRVPLSSIRPSQSGIDYKNASSEAEALEFQKIISGEKDVENHRENDFYPLVVNRLTNKIIDGNHRHYALSTINSPYAVVLYVDVPREYVSEAKNETLRKWFGRKGAPGKSKGWVDCNTCRKDPKTGRKKCKACGRQKGEKRAKYPSCRPTPAACGAPGKGDKWGKTK